MVVVVVVVCFGLGFFPLTDLDAFLYLFGFVFFSTFSGDLSTFSTYCNDHYPHDRSL